MVTEWEEITRNNWSSLQFERDIDIKGAHHNGKTKIDRAPNKKRTIAANKFLNFKNKKKVSSEYKTRKLWTKGTFIN